MRFLGRAGGHEVAKRSQKIIGPDNTGPSIRACEISLRIEWYNDLGVEVVVDVEEAADDFVVDVDCLLGIADSLDSGNAGCPRSWCDPCGLEFFLRP